MQRDRSMREKMKMRDASRRERFLLCLCGLLVLLTYVRAFFGTEITDEAYYISDALAMVQGNIPFAYNNFSYGTGSAFLLIPQVFLYDLLVPDHHGLVLFTRLSFVTFRMVVLFLVYRTLQKHTKRSHALLAVCMMIPYYTGEIDNYSYNTIPMVLCLLVGVWLYDTVEHGGRYGAVKLILCGFLSGIAVFAHPGYGLAVLLFLALLLCRSAGKNRISHTALYALGGILEILVVVSGVALQSGWPTLLRGLDLMFFHPYPAGSLSSVSDSNKLLVLALLAVGIVCCCTVAYFIGKKWYAARLRKAGKNPEPRHTESFGAAFSIGAAVLFLLLLLLFTRGMTALYLLGLLASLAASAVLLRRPRYALLWYVGIYPTLFALGCVFLVDSSDSLARFVAAVPALLPVFLWLLEQPDRWTERCAALGMTVCALLLVGTNYAYVYRDAPITQLDTRVESGVYQGLYTTALRAEALPQLEEYLNGMVAEGEYVAFRDNVPCGYLMLHDARPLDIATWDSLQYSYDRNEPAALYDYYMRRQTIPQKIIYVDYGRDERLSIENPTFLYNDFVNTYYQLKEEIALNDLFQHVMVYAYSGGFDGDFQAWIDASRKLP